jgi:hypothetical protein
MKGRATKNLFKHINFIKIISYYLFKLPSIQANNRCRSQILIPWCHVSFLYDQECGLFARLTRVLLALIIRGGTVGNYSDNILSFNYLVIYVDTSAPTHLTLASSLFIKDFQLNQNTPILPWFTDQELTFDYGKFNSQLISDQSCLIIWLQKASAKNMSNAKWFMN